MALSNYKLFTDFIKYENHGKWGNDLMEILKKLDDKNHYPDWFKNLFDGTIKTDEDFKRLYPNIYSKTGGRRDVKNSYEVEGRTPLMYKRDVEASTIIEDMFADEIKNLEINPKSTRYEDVQKFAKIDEDFIYHSKKYGDILVELKTRYTYSAESVKYRRNEVKTFIDNKSLTLCYFTRAKKVCIIDFENDAYKSVKINNSTIGLVECKEVSVAPEYVFDFEIGISDPSIINYQIERVLGERTTQKEV